MHRTLSAADIAELTRDGNHRVDRGLYLAIRKNGASRSWLFRYSRNGKAHWMGLGPARLVNLTEARRKAVAAEKLLLDGQDPLGARAIARASEKREAQVPTFAECAQTYIEVHEAGWANAKHRYQWKATLEQYAYPMIGKLPVNRIDTDHVFEILQPIWFEKIETAKRLRGRIEKVLDWARSKKYRDGDNPALWNGTLSHRLPAPRRVQKVIHHVAVPYADAPDFYAALGGNENISARLLRFIMLTAARFGEAAGATWMEFDLDAAVWTVPAGRMKMREEHRVPLSVPALEILKALRSEKTKPSDLAFIGQTKGKPVSDTAVRKMLRRVGPDKADTHGLRSTFRDWAAEQTDYPGEIAEAALAHTTGSAVELAYKRTAFLDKRRALMADWADYLTGVKVGPGP